MGLTTQERQDRLWNKAVALRDKADKERAFTALLEACKAAFETSCKRSETNRKWTADDQRTHELLSQAITQAEALCHP